MFHSELQDVGLFQFALSNLSKGINIGKPLPSNNYYRYLSINCNN